MLQLDLSLPPGFDGTVRLFPLGKAVLLPGILRGLHIFEPRYRAMTADALAGDRVLALAVLAEPERAGGRPPALFPMACMGRIVTHNARPDGRYDLLMLGLRRCRILREMETRQPWRSAAVELVREHSDSAFAVRQQVHQELATRIRRHGAAIGIRADQFGSANLEIVPLGLLADTIASACGASPGQMLELLQTEDVVVRARLAIRLIEARAGIGHPGAGFPPPFSAN